MGWMWMTQDLSGDEINIDSGNSLVSSGNKPLPELMLTEFYDAKWRH